jgi:hypothetical protein
VPQNRRTAEPQNRTVEPPPGGASGLPIILAVVAVRNCVR